MSVADCASIGWIGRSNCQPERREPVAARRQRRGGDRSQVAGQHQQPAGPRWPGASAAFATASAITCLQRSLPELAGQEPRKELLLRLRRSGEETRAALRAARPASPRPSSRRSSARRASTSSTVEHGRRRVLGGRSRSAAQPMPIGGCGSSPERYATVNQAPLPAPGARARSPARRSSSGGRASMRPRPRPRRARQQHVLDCRRPARACYCSLACVFYQ